MTRTFRCGAHSRSTGEPCIAKALANGRCKNHGGLSTGPKSAEGRARVGLATKSRMANGQKERAMAGFERWIESRHPTDLSRLASQKHSHSKPLTANYQTSIVRARHGVLTP